MTEEQRHALEHARLMYQAANPDDPTVCFDYELVKTLVALIDDSLKQLVKQSWQPIETAPMDGSEILILTTIGATQARFAPGEWVDHHEGREYNGPAWVCCDDQWNIEIEDCGKDGLHHGMATHWMPLHLPDELREGSK